MFVVEATDGSPSSVNCQGDQDIGPDLTREGPFDVSEVEPPGLEQHAVMKIVFPKKILEIW